MLNVFALTTAETKPFRAAGHQIEFVKYGSVYAAVDRVEQRPAVSEAALRAQHDVVAQIAARMDAVLPARFGSVVEAEELARIVELRRDAIAEALELVRGRDQMTVRLFTDQPVAPPAVRVTPTSGTTYLNERRRAARPPLPDVVASITHALDGIVAASRAEAGHGRVAATLYHLLDRTAIQSYEDAIAEVQQRLDLQTLTVTGPWPPFAFAPELWP